MAETYYTSENITVQFEDGIILTNRTYDQFKKGSIKNPNIVKYNKKSY